MAALCRKGPEPRAVHLCNAYTLSLATRDPALAAVLRRGDLNLPDGMPLVWIARGLKLPVEGRVYGPDLMAATIDRGRAVGLRHYLYGSTPEVVGALGAVIEERWPGALVVGAESPPFRPLTAAEEDALVARVTSAAPDVVWVGLGTPKQDVFVDRFRDRLGTTLVAVGAAFDFHAGTVRQAPRWLQERGLEWAYRLAREPRRLWRRYLVGNAVFLASLVRRRPRLQRSSEGPRGVVIVAGPDGAGKSALSDQLASDAAIDGIEVRRAHWRPRVLSSRSRHGAPVTHPHGQAPRGVALSLLKLVASVLDVWVAFAGPWRRVRPVGLVIWERGWHDLLVDPVRYRLHPAVLPFARLLSQLVPRADAILLVGGSAAAVHHRKPELGIEEISRQTESWHRLAPRAASAVVTVDTVTLEVKSAAAAARRALVGERWTVGPGVMTSVAWRRVPLTPSRVGLLSSGGIAARPALDVYRPFRPAARLGLALARRAPEAAWPPAPEPGPPVVELLGDLVPAASGWSVLRSSAPGRVVVGVACRGSLAFVAKVGPANDAGLRNEARTLEAIDGHRLRFTVPRLRWSGTRAGWRVLLLEALHRERGSVPDDSVLGLCVGLGSAAGGLVHGDLAPWNLLRCEGRLGLVDWEAARRGVAPLHDLAHFVIQRGALLGTYPPARAARMLTGTTSLGTRYLLAIGEERAKAPMFVDEYLSAAPHTDDHQVAQYRRKVQEALP